MSGFRWHLHRVTLSEIDDSGFIGIQFDAFGEQDSGMPTIELHHQLGFLSRPPDPTVGADGEIAFGANVLIAEDGEERHAWLAADPRLIPKLPSLQPGDALMYGSAGNFVRCHADGRVSLFTTDDGTVNGKTVAFQVMPDGFLMSGPWGSLKFDASGFHVQHISGAEIHAGAIGGLPPPLDQLGSYVKLHAALMQTEASIVTSGDATTPGDALTKSTPLLAALASLATAATDLATMLPTLVSGGGPVTAPTLVATAAAFTALASAIGAATPLIPSTSTAAT
jgi:hypothetical protein